MYTVEDLANTLGICRQTMSKYISKLLKAKKFRREFGGYLFTANEVKKLGELFGFDLDEVKAAKEKHEQKK